MKGTLPFAFVCLWLPPVGVPVRLSPLSAPHTAEPCSGICPVSHAIHYSKSETIATDQAEGQWECNHI